MPQDPPSFFADALLLVARFVYWSVDPIFTRSIIPAVGHTPIRSWSISVSAAALLLLVFYWHETTSSTSMRFSWSIEKFKRICYPLLVFIFVLELVANVMYYTGAEFYALVFVGLIYPIVYLIISMSLALYFSITAARILYKLYQIESKEALSEAGQSRPKGASKRKGLRTVATKLLLVGIFHIMACLVGLYTLNRQYTLQIPNHYMYMWIALHFVINCRAASAIWMLKPRKGTTHSTASRSSVHSNSASGGANTASGNTGSNSV